MEPDASMSVAGRRAGGIVLVVLAILGIVSAVFVVRRPLLMAVPSCTAGRWHGCFDTINGTVLVTVAALPLAGLAAWALASLRSVSGVTPSWRMSLAEVGIVYGTVPWVWMILLPGDESGAGLSLVPLRDLLTMDTVQIVGNLLVFAALGFLVPVRFAALASVPRILAVAATCSVVVESAQYVLQLDRVSSVDDVLLNAAGAGLAALASRRWWRTAA
ncbi:VanZ family protein [Actinomadura sp. NPDC048955]|uniref:VanZ family protein n=1 Tax=Actinomadura sp. NPDC048955 TaxID=3158228 RepID=UPI0033CC2DCB